jgi:hypothetical protein
MQSAGHATFTNPGDYKQQLMSDNQRNNVGAVPYSGIQHSNEDLVKLFRSKLALRGARGILGM